MANKRKPFNATLTLTTADTEYSYQIPEGTVSFQLKSRGNRRIKCAFVAGDIALLEYFSVGEGAQYSEENLYLEGVARVSIYAQCAVAGEVLEICGWKQ